MQSSLFYNGTSCLNLLPSIMVACGQTAPSWGGNASGSGTIERNKEAKRSFDINYYNYAREIHPLLNYANEKIVFLRGASFVGNTVQKMVEWSERCKACSGVGEWGAGGISPKIQNFEGLTGLGRPVLKAWKVENLNYLSKVQQVFESSISQLAELTLDKHHRQVSFCCL